jgi:TatA/E family protein of Tat protein translocase
MPSLGPAEILVILVVALLVFGPTKMPEMARQAGRAFKEFRRVQQHLRSEISGAMSDLDVGTMGDPASTTGPEASDMMGGGDPVPMLPPKDVTTSAPTPATPPATPGAGAADGDAPAGASDEPTTSSPPPADPT